MPYWSIYCLYCGGYLVDGLLECLPAAKQNTAAFLLLFRAEPGAALACPYCNGLIGFDSSGKVCTPASGWPVFRYGQHELELKKLADGEPTTVSLAEWALKHRFPWPGSHKPLEGYTYAEQAPADETVP
jgi:hypothetical protein